MDGLSLLSTKRSENENPLAFTPGGSSPVFSFGPFHQISPGKMKETGIQWLVTWELRTKK